MNKINTHKWQNMHHDLDDHELIHLYKNKGDKELLACLFYRYSDMLYGLCLKYLKDEDDASDAMYEIFEGLITKVKNHEVSNFKSWLYRLSCNHCLDKLRNKKKLPTRSIDELAMQFSDASYDLIDSMKEKELILKKIDFCLNQLSPQQKETVELFFFQDQSYNEISERLSISWDQTRSLIQNGKRNLKNCMELKESDK